MSIHNTVNLGGISPTMQWADSDSDIFSRAHVANTAQAVDLHDHTSTKGLAVGRLNVTNALTNPGDVFIKNDGTFTYRDNQGTPANHTVLTADLSASVAGNITLTGNLNHSGGSVTAGWKPPAGAGAAPTTLGVVAFNTTTKALVYGDGAVTQTVLSTGGGALAASSGGTGVTSLPAHGVVLGEGTSAVNSATPGTAGYPLISNGTSSDPSFAQVGTAGIANGAIISALIADGTITGTDIASGTITGSNIASGTITASNLASSAIAAASSATDTTTSSTASGWVTLNNSAVTITASGTGVVVLMANFATSQGGDGIRNLGIYKDGSLWNSYWSGSAGSGFTNPDSIVDADTPTAGSHTYKLAWNNAAFAQTITSLNSKLTVLPVNS